MVEAIEKVKSLLNEFVVSNPGYAEYVNTFKSNINLYTVDQLIDLNTYESIEWSNYRMVNLYLRYLKDAPKGDGYERLAEMFVKASKDIPQTAWDSVFPSVRNWYVGGLGKEIDNCKDLREIQPIVKVYRKLVTEGIDVSGLKDSLALKITTLAWDLVEPDNEVMEDGSYLENLEALAAVQDDDFELDSTIYTLFDSVHRYLQNRYNVYNLKNRESDQNKEYGKKLVIKLKKFQLKDDFELKQREELKEFFGCVYEEAAEEPDLAQFVRPEGVSSNQIDFNDVKLEKIIYTNVNNPNLAIYIYTARSSILGEIAVKAYQATATEYLQSIYNEIDILEFLSHYSTEDNCFMKFFGKYIENLTVYLAMEYHPKTLMKTMSEMKTAGQKFNDSHIYFYASSLLQGFAFMEGMNIFHQDIKPHNILVTSSWRLKIIDFSVSNKKDNIEAQTLHTGMLEIQGTRGYMAPELEEGLINSKRAVKFRRNKADVFSLGMTLLQMYSFEDLHTLNYRSNNKQLMEKVKVVHIPWFRTLLEKMLQVEYGIRPSFKECLQFLPGNEATYVN